MGRTRYIAKAAVSNISDEFLAGAAIQRVDVHDASRFMIASYGSGEETALSAIRCNFDVDVVNTEVFDERVEPTSGVS